MKELIQKMSIQPKFKDSLDSIPSMFFTVLDLENDGILTKRELGVGLFVLCGGTMAEKLRYIGQLFDANGDERLSR